MFEKYNEKARRALFFARYEASKLGSRVIESEHILLGVLREGEEIIKEIFSRFNVKPEQIRREVEGDRLFVDRISSSAELPLSEESKKILAYAAHEAESMLHQYVGTEHLLIGILRVESSTAARILRDITVNFTTVLAHWRFHASQGGLVVVEVMRFLEERIKAMIDIWGLDGARAAEAAVNLRTLPGASRRSRPDAQRDVGPSLHSGRTRPLQLTNRRVESPGCSIAPQSRIGMKQKASSMSQVALRAAVSIISGFRLQRIRVASLCPSGNKRWQAETRLEIDW